MKYSIEKLNIQDSDEILKIENESFTAPWTKRSIDSALTSSVVHFYGYFDEAHKLVGFVCASVIAPEAEILNIAVSEACRGCGIGRRLLDYMISYLKDMTVTTVYLEVRESNVPAKSLYLNHGFDIIGVRKKYYSSPTEDAILMHKIIE